MKSPQNKLVDTFMEYPEGLFVRVPGRTDVEIIRKAFGFPPPDNFTLIRPLVNFKINIKGHEESDAPYPDEVELVVRFTQSDLDLAGGLPIFTYYDPIFPGGAKWRFPIVENPNSVTTHWFFETGMGGGFVGYQRITLPGWPGDPGNGWGV